ncbi:MAG TPA: preprotein translocase subunit SecE [Candidatus Dormibacteraeota bacterium]
MAVTARRTDQDQEFGVVRFLREVYDELRKVVWPTPGELWRYTMVVVATVVVLAVFIGGVDLVVGEAVKRWVYSGLSRTG